MKQNLFFLPFLATVLILISSCAHSNKLANDDFMMTKTDKEEVLKMVLDHSDLQIYLHPETSGRVPVKIKSNDELGSELFIEKFNAKVEFINSIDLSQNPAILDVVSFSYNDKKVVLEIHYAIEGITITGKLIKETNGWSFEDFEVFES